MVGMAHPTRNWGMGVMNKSVAFLIFGIAITTFGPGCQAPPGVCTTDCEGAETEPNNVFAVASRTILDQDELVISGSIDRRGDIDVFDLGTMITGDVLDIRVQSKTSTLQPAIALYNQLNELVNEDTLTSVLAGSELPQITHVVRSDSNPFYLAISHSVAGVTTGQYELDVTVARKGATPEPIPQVFYLNFGGGEIDDSIFGSFEAGPFDAGDIDNIYAGQTQLMIEAIIATMKQNYARFDVTILDSINDGPLPGGDVSEILFGGFNTLAFGAAQDVDLYNDSRSDKAIVFTESFETELFAIPPTPEGMSVAIANVAAHEAGHLLGLHHVRDPDALMDEASPTFTLLADQEFMTATLSTAIFPLGIQDSPSLLEVIVGMNPEAQPKTQRLTVEAPQQSPDSTRAKCLNCLQRAALTNGSLITKD